MTQYLDKILERKKAEVAQLKADFGYGYFKEKAENRTRPSFKDALQKPGLSLIAELKKASPSKGIIRQVFDPVALAQTLEAGGAKALSILTEKHFFLGDPTYVEAVADVTSLPILRKDFLIDPIQVIEAKAIGASAILLIRAICNDDTLDALLTEAKLIGLDVLVEIHDEAEYDSIKDRTDIDILGVNNRNLRNFEVDSQTANRLRRYISPKPYTFVAESGYSQASQLEGLETLGVDAVLIGEGLAKQPEMLTYFQAHV